MRHSNASDFVKCAACRAVYDWGRLPPHDRRPIDQSTTVARRPSPPGGPHERATSEGSPMATRVLVMIGAPCDQESPGGSRMAPRRSRRFHPRLGRSCHSRTPTPSGLRPAARPGVAVRPCRASTASALDHLSRPAGSRIAASATPSPPASPSARRTRLPGDQPRSTIDPPPPPHPWPTGSVLATPELCSIREAAELIGEHPARAAVVQPGTSRMPSRPGHRRPDGPGLRTGARRPPLPAASRRQAAPHGGPMRRLDFRRRVLNDHEQRGRAMPTARNRGG